MHRDLVAEIIRWSATRTGTIGGPSWKGVGLHVIHDRPVGTALGCHEEYRPGGHGGPNVSGGGSLTVSQTAFGHNLIQEFINKIIQEKNWGVINKKGRVN